jgi:hypothetical protein
MSLPVEEVVTANGAIGGNGQLVTDFGGYARAPNTYPCILGVYYSSDAAADVELFMVPALGAGAVDTVPLADVTAQTSFARTGRWVPSNPATGEPFLLVTRKSGANATFRVLWEDVARP